jgi:hypothetical protein
MSFSSGFLKTSATRLMKEYAKDPEKIKKLLGGLRPSGRISPNSITSSASGLGDSKPRRLFDSLKDSVPIRDLSYQHPAKRAATVKTPSGHFAQVDARVPKEWDSLPDKGPILKLRAGIAERVAGEGEHAVSNSKQNVLERIKRTAAKLKEQKKPDLEINQDLGYRTIGSKKKVTLTHTTGRSGKGILTKDPYISYWGAKDGGAPQSVYSHFGKKSDKLDSTIARDPHTNTGGRVSKIKSRVPEDSITYRPSDTGLRQEAVTHVKDFKSHMLRHRRPRLK